MKLIISIITFMFLLSSCDDNEINKPIKPIEKYLFEIKINKQWIFTKNNSEAKFTVTNLDSANWVIDYWDTTRKVNLLTYTIEWLEFDNQLPRYTNFGISPTDSSYLFGTTKHHFVSANYPTEFFVFLFEIPKSLRSGLNKQKELSRNIGNDVLFWKYNYNIKNTGKIIFNNEEKNLWTINYLAERKRPLPTIYSEEFVFVDSIGFYSYKNYLLKKVENP